MRVIRKISRDANPVVLATSLVAGFGMTLSVVALAVGVVQGNTQYTSLTFVAGLLLFIMGLVGWLGVVQPYRHFDDINVPAPDEHHHEEHDEHAIEPAPDAAVMDMAHH